MNNEKPFDLEEWLNSKKKGIGGKVPRADFISKIKELGTEIADKESLLTKKDDQIEQLRQEKTQLASQNKELDQQLKTSQSDLTGWDKIIQEKDKTITEIKSNSTSLQSHINEQEKISQNQAEELKILQKRPDVTPEKYQELLNNQEKHKEEDLKPTNLPTDWEKQLSDKKIIEKNFADTEKKLSATEEKFLELSAKQKKISETETKLAELEKRPTAEQLQQAVQQEANKYKDYQKLTEKDQEKLKAYDSLKTELEKLTAKLEKYKLSQPKETDRNNGEKIIEEIKKWFTSLKQELELLKQYLEQNQSQPTKLPFDYEKMKEDNENLCKILQIWKLKLLETENNK